MWFHRASSELFSPCFDLCDFTLLQVNYFHPTSREIFLERFSERFWYVLYCSFMWISPCFDTCIFTRFLLNLFSPCFSRIHPSSWIFLYEFSSGSATIWIHVFHSGFCMYSTHFAVSLLQLTHTVLERIATLLVS